MVANVTDTSFTFVARTTTAYIWIKTGNVTEGVYVDVDNISIRKVNTVFDERGPELVASSASWAFAGDDTGITISSDGSTISSDGSLSGTANATRLLPGLIDPGTYEMTFDANQNSNSDILDGAGAVLSNITAGAHKF